MALIQRQAAQTIEEETSRFMDANFGGLDLSSFPQLQPPPPETSPLDDRFSKPYSSFHGLDSSRLREFLSAPDADALADLATADPEMAERVEDKVAQEAAEEFVRSNPDYLRTDLNFQTILDYLTNQYRSRDVDEFEDTDDAIRALVRVNAWTMTELTKAYRQLLRDGSLSIPANQPRSLTDRERTQCAQLAANGDVIGAVYSTLPGWFERVLPSSSRTRLFSNAQFSPEAGSSSKGSDQPMVPAPISSSCEIVYFHVSGD